jgi:hypothetical protein
MYGLRSRLAHPLVFRHVRRRLLQCVAASRMSQGHLHENASFAEKALALGINAVQAASTACMKVQRDLHSKDVANKDDDTPVTIADYAVQAIVAWVLQQSCDTRYECT